MPDGPALAWNVHRRRDVSCDRRVLDLIPEPAETDKAFRRGKVLGELSSRVVIDEGRRVE
jgi:hypothetical protein